MATHYIPTKTIAKCSTPTRKKPQWTYTHAKSPFGGWAGGFQPLAFSFFTDTSERKRVNIDIERLNPRKAEDFRNELIEAFLDGVMSQPRRVIITVDNIHLPKLPEKVIGCLSNIIGMDRSKKRSLIAATLPLPAVTEAFRGYPFVSKDSEYFGLWLHLRPLSQKYKILTIIGDKAC
jgi:hypothetical protein